MCETSVFRICVIDCGVCVTVLFVRGSLDFGGFFLSFPFGLWGEFAALFFSV